ncbi:unnamed protein product [Closterium sp. NIES-53]
MGVSHLHDLGLVTNFPVDEHVASCIVGTTGAPLATFHRESDFGLYSLHTGSHHTGSDQVRSDQCAAPHSSSFLPTTAPFQTLQLDVWGPSPVLGPCQERYFLVVVDDYSRYTTVFPLRRKADVPTLLEPWLLAWVRYAAHQLNLWPSDARPRVTPVSLSTGSPGVAADFRVWGSLAHVPAPSTNKLSPRTRAYVFLGFPLDASSWVFYDLVTYQFFASQDVTLGESVCYYRSRPHRDVSHVTLQSSPPQRSVPVMSGGAGGAVAEGEGIGAAEAGGVGSGGVGVVGVEVTPVEDIAASSLRPHPASPPCFPFVPQFPPRSSLRPVAADPGGVPSGGTGGPGGVSGGGACSGGAGAGGTGTVGTAAAAATAAIAVGAISIAAAGERRGGFTAAAGESRGVVTTAVAAVVAAAARESKGGVTSVAAGAIAVGTGESRGGVTAALGDGREGVPPAAAGAVTDTAGESRGQERAEAEPREQQQGQVEEAEQQRLHLRDLPDPTHAHLVHGPLPFPPVPSVESLSSSQWTHRSPLSRVVSPEPRRSRYRADGPFHLVLRSRVPPPPVFPQPPESFSFSHRLDYAAHLVSGHDRSPSSGGAPVFPLKVLEDRQFERGFLAAAVPHLCAMLLALEGDPDALDIPIPRTHAEAVLHLSLFVRRGSTPFFVLILMRFHFPFSKVQLTPLTVDHGLTAPPSDEPIESSGPYLELVGCLMYLMTCTHPDLAYPLSVLTRFVAPRRDRPSHGYAAKRVAKYVASTSGMGLVLGGKQPVTLTVRD